VEWPVEVSGQKKEKERDSLRKDSEKIGKIELEMDTGFLQNAKLRLCGFDKEGGEDSNEETGVMESSAVSTLTEEV
jgi:hypothetical protein